jgi:hypothetical protein
MTLKKRFHQGVGNDKRSCIEVTLRQRHFSRVRAVFQGLSRS